MADSNRILWSEGMFLRPQHFQQQDRYHESVLQQIQKSLKPHWWGFLDVDLDANLYKQGKLALTRATGIFQDGTPFDMPGRDPLPAILDLNGTVNNEKVFLGLPIRKQGATEFDRESQPDPLCRYREAEREAIDTLVGSDSSYPIHIGLLKTRLLLESEERSGYQCLLIAEVQELRREVGIELKPTLIPTHLALAAAPSVSGFIKSLIGKLGIRGDELAARLGSVTGGAIAQQSDFMLLQAINRYESHLRVIEASGNSHPEPLFALLASLAGELSTFFSDSRRPRPLKPYVHDDPEICFAPLFEELDWLLGKVKDAGAVRIPLQNPRPGIYGAQRPDPTLIENALFILAVKADMPAPAVQSQFPLQTKIAPVEKIQQLVLTQIPGIPLVPLPVAPRQIPFHVGFCYFELNQQHDMWREISSSGGFAFHIGGQFPGLELEFWAIKKN